MGKEDNPGVLYQLSWWRPHPPDIDIPPTGITTDEGFRLVAIPNEPVLLKESNCFRSNSQHQSKKIDCLDWLPVWSTQNFVWLLQWKQNPRCTKLKKEHQASPSQTPSFQITKSIAGLRKLVEAAWWNDSGGGQVGPHFDARLSSHVPHCFGPQKHRLFMLLGGWTLCPSKDALPHVLWLWCNSNNPWRCEVKFSCR